jgi:hypothetical protein
MEQTECSETSAYKIQTPGNYPEENIQHTEQGESLKSRNKDMAGFLIFLLKLGSTARRAGHPCLILVVTFMLLDSMLIVKYRGALNQFKAL